MLNHISYVQVGRGYLRPDASKIRPDTPRALMSLYERCIKFSRDERPEFGEVYSVALVPT